MTTLHLTLFGGFSVEQNDIAITKFRSDKVRALLAYLTVEADRPQRRETLATLFWPEMTDSVAKRNLRQSLHRLKQAVTLPDGWLEMTRQTVLLHSEAVVTDFGRFQAHVKACENHEHQHLHSCDPCLQHLSEAVALYQGDFLQGLSLPDATGFEEWQTIVRERAHQQALTVLELLTKAHEAQENYAEALHCAQQQLALEAWRESAHRQAMRLLMLQEQRRAALAQYDRCVLVLNDELGVEPEELTQALYQQIVDGTFSAETYTPTSTTLHHFPTYLTPFIGRSTEQAQIITHIINPDCRLLTVVGTGGMGKTRLSVAVATQLARTHEQFTNGLIFFPFAPVNSVDQFLSTIAAQLGVLLPDEAPSLEKIIQHQADKQQLWVLDNVEHLLEATPLIVELLTALPELTLLVTSREALRISAEWLLPLAGLDHAPNQEGSTSDAEALFWQVAKQRQLNLSLTAANGLIAQKVCRWVEGMPLAIEMVASWLRHLSLPEIDEQIGNLDLLVSSLRNTPDRQQSLVTIFESTWNLLAPSAQEALAKLTVFRGDFGMASLSSIVNVSLLDTMTLLDHFVLQQSAPGRYQFHTLMWQLASAKAQAYELLAVERNHAEFYLQLLVENGAQLRNLNAPQAADAIRSEWDNIWQAWHVATRLELWPLLQQATSALTLYAHHQSFWPPIEQAFHTTLAHLRTVPTDDPQVELTTIILKSRIAHLATKLNMLDASTLLDEILPLCSQTNYPALYHQLLADRGIAYWRRGKSDQAMKWLKQALTLACDDEDRQLQPYIKHHLANVYATKRQFELAEPLYVAAFAEYRAVDNLTDCAGALGDYGACAFMVSKNTPHTAVSYEQPLNYMEEGYALFKQLDHRFGMSLSASNLGYAHLISGNFRKAQLVLEDFLASDSVTIYGGIYLNLGHTYLKQGLFEQAAENYRRVWRLVDPLVGTVVVAHALCGLAHIYFKQGKVTDTAFLLGVSNMLSGIGDGASLDYIEDDMFDENVEMTRAALGTIEFDRLFELGAAVPLDELVDRLADYVNT